MKINFFQEINFTEIPFTWGCKTVSISIDGQKSFILDCTDENTEMLLKWANTSVKSFVELNKEKYAIGEPSLNIKLDGIYTIQIPVMEIEEYEKKMAALIGLK